LEKTLIEVQKLKKEHLVEIKSFSAPAEVVKLVCQAVVILNIDSITKKGGSVISKNVQGAIGKKEEDYFETAKKYLLNEPKELLDMLLDYDKNSIKGSAVAKVEQGCFSNPNFNLESAKHSSYAVQFLFAWVKAMVDYFKVYTETKPLREKLGVMQKIVEEKTAELRLKKEALDEINGKIAELEQMFADKVAQKEKLTFDIMQCEIKLDRAQKLTEGLSDEKENWTKDIQMLSLKFDYIPGDSVLSAGMVSYAGAFTSHYRQELEKSWLKLLDEIGLKRTEEMTMVKFLGDSVKIQQWNIAGLPKDDCSIENGIIIDKARRWPLMIDPQTQANKFIKNMGKEHPESIDVVKTSDQNLSRTIELAIQFGKWVLLENIGKELDPALEPILLQQVIRTSSSASIVIGDKTIPYNDHFKFFMTTTLPNPHYSPETSVKVTIINFAITPSGLEEQMLATIVGLENQVLEQKKIEIVKKNAQDRRDLLNIQDSILKSLSETKGDISEILMDEKLINNLSTSKKFAAEINQRVKDSKVTEAQIDKARESYRPVAYRASLLFFCIMDLSNIDPMYQYSLQWFTNLFVMGVEHAAPSTVPEQRLDNLNTYFTYSLYENICRSLFEKHKLIFSLLLTVKILQGSKNINEKEWKYLLTGPTTDIKVPPNPTTWIAENSWPAVYKELHGMGELEAFQGVEDHFMKTPDDFKGKKLQIFIKVSLGFFF
jgi:dynein heavy chain, axonemal